MDFLISLEKFTKFEAFKKGIVNKHAQVHKVGDFLEIDADNYTRSKSNSLLI